VNNRAKILNRFENFQFLFGCVSAAVHTLWPISSETYIKHILEATDNIWPWNNLQLYLTLKTAVCLYTDLRLEHYW